MRRRASAHRSGRLTAILLAAGLALSGCATSASRAPSPSASVTPEAPTSSPTSTPATETPAPPTPTPATTFWTSSVYPYTLQLPAGTTTRVWAGATRQWDGQKLVGTATPWLTDLQGTTDGSLYVFGTEWDGTVEQFRDHVLAATARFHRCSQAEEEIAFELPDAPAIAFRQTCGGDRNAASVVTVHEGFGLVFRLLDVPPDKLSVVLADLQTWLQGGLTWTN